jgi:hypothetical protein
MSLCVKINYLGYAVSVFRDSSVAIETVYRLDDQGSIPGRDKFFFFSTTSRPALGPPSLISNGYWGDFVRNEVAGA